MCIAGYICAYSQLSMVERVAPCILTDCLRCGMTACAAYGTSAGFTVSPVKLCVSGDATGCALRVAACAGNFV